MGRADLTDRQPPIPDAYSAARKAAQRLLAEVLQRVDFNALTGPEGRPRHWLKAGRDYDAALIRGSSNYAPLDRALAEAFPHRFQGAGRGRRESTDLYIHALVEGLLTQLSRLHGRQESRPSVIEAALAELFEMLSSATDEVRSARIITDVEVNSPLQIGDVEIRPVGGQHGLRDAYWTIESEIPGAFEELDRAIGFGRMSFQYVVLFTTARSAAPDAVTLGYSVAERVCSAKFAAVISAIRMASGCTAETIVQLGAPPGWVRIYEPAVLTFDYSPMPMIERIVRMTADSAVALAKLTEWLNRWTGSADKPQALGIALDRFNRSFSQRYWFDQLVDLAVALEAALSGGGESKEEIALRLRTRAAHLLGCAEDPASGIYGDVKHMYNLRSRIVHGAPLTEAQIYRLLGSMTGTARTDLRGVKGALALDRFRDVVRRAILARGFLAAADTWPMSGRKLEDLDVDGALFDPAQRAAWQTEWRGQLDSIGLASAANPAIPASLETHLPARP